MTLIHLRHLILLVSAAGVLAGCASPKEAVTFVTRTSFSLVDIDATPGSMSIGYERVEGYMGPRYADGNVFPVASSIETRGKGINREIRQVYATGNAARIVTAKNAAAPRPASTASAPDASSNKVMFFGTGTTVGVTIGFAQGSPLPNSFTLGYKRKEASVIPVEPGHEPSVLGTFDNSAGVDAPQGTQHGAALFDVEQYFATGVAADNLSQKQSIKDRFQQSAERAIGDVEKYRSEEARQGRLALDTLKCFTELGDDKLTRVWGNAEDLAIFGDLGTLPRIRGAPSPQKQREIYVADMGLLNPDDADHTTALKFHKKLVCEMSKPTT